LATFLLAAFNLLSQSKAFIRKSVHLVKVFIKQHVSVRLCPSHRHERAYFGVKQSATELFSTLFGEFVIQKQQWKAIMALNVDRMSNVGRQYTC